MKQLSFILLFLSSFISGRSLCQSLPVDIKFIENKDFNIVAGDNNYRGKMQVNNKSAIKYSHKKKIARYNPFSLAATTAMLVYQNIISPQLFRHCIYQISCSNYSKKAINELGLFKGIFMSADRLLRCNMSAINDIPIEEFDENGYAIDEPDKYHLKNR
ncbi:MAG: membrane protein insertion efficiency factor YidD [Bacteroidales bacterium]